MADRHHDVEPIRVSRHRDPPHIPPNPSHANTVFGKKITCFLRVLKLALDLSIYICSNILILYIIATICTHEHYSTRLFLTAGAGLQATFSCVFQSISWQHMFIHDKGSLYFLRLTNLSIHKQLKTQASWVSATDSYGEKSLPPLQWHFAHSNDVMCKQPIADWTRMQGVIIVILCKALLL